MRKILLTACLFVSTIIACAQLSCTPGKSYTNLSGINYVFIFNRIDSLTKITYNNGTPGAIINWYKYSNLNIPILSGTNVLDNLNDATGYVLDVDGVQTTFWVIDYANYLPKFNSFEPENKPESQCQEVNLLINANIPVLSYQTLDGTIHVLPRNFVVTYQTLKWDNTNNDWATDNSPSIPVTLPATQVTVPAPYCNTIFTIKGDQYATDLGIPATTYSSSLYQTYAEICKLITKVTSRDQGVGNNNEGFYPTSTTPINFSAPIDVQFLSNANIPPTLFYNWGIYKDKKLIVTRTDKDQRYTFTEAGTYNVKLTVSNSVCSFSDSIAVIVSESAIYVPDVFTPNGDGLNDEFRVAYKSLISFQCWVYNRWGRQVYYWNDPMKGWDGNINGKKATPGPYFYVIKALGSDNKVYKLKGDINLLRGTGK